ncbi:hypothetical protein FG386_002029 [Cryptosporidium ryanae]|uniref:uncharacterized protein n=1 Tax=Cryptosporidium ryanae TaxID=515981 RepID=UPI003519EE59|nr:hypothetical protein FG386_002029 [Cryptosporidium ryanae]
MKFQIKLLFFIFSLFFIGFSKCDESVKDTGENELNNENSKLPEENLRKLYGKGHYSTAYEPVYVQKMQYVPVKTYKKVMYTTPEKSTYTIPSKQQVRYVPAGYAKGVPSPQMYVPVSKEEPNVYVPVTYSKGGVRYLEETVEHEPVVHS